MTTWSQKDYNSGFTHVIHHIYLGCTNIITKISTNLKGITGLVDKGAPVEFKDINNESFSKRKVAKFEGI